MDRPASPDPERMLAAEDQGEEEVLERYSRGVTSVQSILALDKLRQEVAVREKLSEMGQPLKKLPVPMPPKPPVVWCGLSVCCVCIVAPAVLLYISL